MSLFDVGNPTAVVVTIVPVFLCFVVSNIEYRVIPRFEHGCVHFPSGYTTRAVYKPKHAACTLRSEIKCVEISGPGVPIAFRSKCRSKQLRYTARRSDHDEIHENSTDNIFIKKNKKPETQVHTCGWAPLIKGEPLIRYRQRQHYHPMWGPECTQGGSCHGYFRNLNQKSKIENVAGWPKVLPLPADFRFRVTIAPQS